MKNEQVCIESTVEAREWRCEGDAGKLSENKHLALLSNLYQALVADSAYMSVNF